MMKCSWELGRILAELNKLTDDDVLGNYHAFKKKWLQPSGVKGAKYKLEDIFGGNFKASSKRKRVMEDSDKWELDTTIMIWRHTIKKVFYNAKMGSWVDKTVSWTDCPGKKYCTNHKMTAKEKNIAQTKYPEFHKQDTKYRTSNVEHLICNVFRYSYNAQGRRCLGSGAPHIIKHPNRTSTHLFPGPHSNHYVYCEWALLCICLDVLYIYI